MKEEIKEKLKALFEEGILTEEEYKEYEKREKGAIKRK